MMQTSTWFEDWFDSPYYHLLYNKRDDVEAEFFIRNIFNLIKFTPHSKIWDISCGKGRHCISFAEKGMLVTGSDLSFKSISEAQSQNIPNTEFLIHDMRKLFRTSYFDCALNLFTSIGYFEKYEENFSVFKNISVSLRPNGIFIVDFFNSNKIIKTLKKDYSEQREEINFKINKQIIDKRIHKKIKFDHKNKSFCFEECVCLLDKEDFDKFGKNCGLKLEHVFGDYSLHKFNLQTSDRLILIFKK